MVVAALWVCGVRTAAASATGLAYPQGSEPAAGDTVPIADALDSALAVATFDSAWRTVAISLENRGVSRPDWDAVRRELLPAASRARSDGELRVIIEGMLRRLGESHFAVLPAPTASADGDMSASTATALGSAGIEPRLVHGRLAVWRADGAAARVAGVQPGWTIVRIGDFTVPALETGDSVGARRLAVLTGALHALRGAPGTTVHVVVRDANGVQHGVSVVRDSVRGPLSRFGNLPPLPAHLEMSRRSTADGRCIGVIQFEYWLPPVMPALDRAVDTMRDCAGIILDLRGNLGGVAGMVMGVAGHFVNEPRTLGSMRARGDEMRFVANPRRVTDAGAAVEPFAGSLAILVDELSASTSEIFAAALQAIGRARIFGERTPGQALPAIATRLPNGDVLMHVVADFIAPDGSRIEGRGVLPDERVPLELADLRAGRDAPFEAAVHWIERAQPMARR